jgi:outer membrane protein OmpA-like peptidoglycan-associated protein
MLFIYNLNKPKKGKRYTMKNILLFLSLILVVSCTKKTTVVTPTPVIEKPKAVMVFKKEPEIKEVKSVEPVKPVTVTVYFDFDSYVLKESEKWKLSDINRPVNLVGGCCPIGTEEYNYTLGLNRAYSVKRYFDEIGIKVLTVRSVGENDLKSTLKSDYNDNRRCEITY